MVELSDVNLQLSKKIVTIVEHGNSLHGAGAHEAALEKYRESWELLPEPKQSWDLAHWIAKCTSRLYLELGVYGEAKTWSLRAVESKPPRETSSLILLGASCLGLGEEEFAYEFFNKVFEMGKARAFQGFDKKYLHFLTDYKEKNDGLARSAI